IVIGIGGGGGQHDPRAAEKKDDKQKDDPVANDAPRPLKYDNGAYRRLADSLLARGRVDAALRMISLLKEQEYYEYTGSFGDAIASAPELPAPPDYTALAVR